MHLRQKKKLKKKKNLSLSFPLLLKFFFSIFSSLSSLTIHFSQFFSLFLLHISTYVLFFFFFLSYGRKYHSLSFNFFFLFCGGDEFCASCGWNGYEFCGWLWVLLWWVLWLVVGVVVIGFVGFFFFSPQLVVMVIAGRWWWFVGWWYIGSLSFSLVDRGGGRWWIAVEIWFDFGSWMDHGW